MPNKLKSHQTFAKTQMGHPRPTWDLNYFMFPFPRL